MKRKLCQQSRGLLNDLAGEPYQRKQERVNKGNGAESFDRNSRNWQGGCDACALLSYFLEDSIVARNIDIGLLPQID